MQISFNTHISSAFMTTNTLKIVVKVENQQVAKLAKSTSVLLLYIHVTICYSDRSFFCLLNYHNDSSTISVTFIVKFWSTSIEMIS